MGFSGISFTEILIILAIVILLFGSKKIANLGTDLGTAIRGFRKALSKESDDTDKSPHNPA